MRFLVPLLFMVCIFRPAWAADMSSFDEAMHSKQPLSDWQRANRFMSFSVDTLDRHYVETDVLGLTANGVFDREDGRIPGAAAKVRWLGTLNPQTGSQLLLESAYSTWVGDTAYDGYLQTTPLTPFKTTTHNAIGDAQVRGGVSLGETPGMLLVSFVEYRYHFWLRDVGSYDEAYQHHAAMAGLLAAWRLSPLLVVEAEGAVGRIFYAHIDVPQVPLSESLGPKVLTSFGVTGSLQVTNRWSVFTGWRSEKSAYGESAVSNGHFEPPSTTAAKNIQVGVLVRY